MQDFVACSARPSAMLRREGDTVGNLMWRLEHGESPAGAGVRVIVLLIGANDLLIAAGDVRRLRTRGVPQPRTRSQCWLAYVASTTACMRSLRPAPKLHHRRTELRIVACMHEPGITVLRTSQGPQALDSAVPRAASHIVSVVRRLLEDEPGARVLLMPVLPGGDYSQPLPQRLAYPNRSAPASPRRLPF